MIWSLSWSWSDVDVCCWWWRKNCSSIVLSTGTLFSVSRTVVGGRGWEVGSFRFHFDDGELRFWMLIFQNSS